MLTTFQIATLRLQFREISPLAKTALVDNVSMATRDSNKQCWSQGLIKEVTTEMLNQEGVRLILAEFAGGVKWWLTVEEWLKMKCISD